MKATPAFVTVCMLLGCSVMVNLIVIFRPREEAPTPRNAPALAAEARPAAPGEAPVPMAYADRSRSEPVRRTAEAAPAEFRPGAVSAPKGGSVKDDPAVAAVIEAQDSFGAFWKDLERLFKAKSRLDDAKVFETALGTTMDFLELPAGSRPRFFESARAGVALIAQARREYEAGRKAIPPRDKSNPASVALYDQQKNAVDDRYQEQVRVAVEGVKSNLDASRPRHVEFGGAAEKWLKSLVPKGAQP